MSRSPLRLSLTLSRSARGTSGCSSQAKEPCAAARVDFSFRVAIAEVGDSNFELLSPVSGDTLYVEHLEAHGEGFHHTCIAYPTAEAIEAAKTQFASQGREQLQSGSLGEFGEFCYFDVPEMGGVLELLYLTGLPEPEKTIQ